MPDRTDELRRLLEERLRHLDTLAVETASAAKRNEILKLRDDITRLILLTTSEQLSPEKVKELIREFKRELPSEKVEGSAVLKKIHQYLSALST